MKISAWLSLFSLGVITSQIGSAMTPPNPLIPLNVQDVVQEVGCGPIPIGRPCDAAPETVFTIGIRADSGCYTDQDFIIRIEQQSGAQVVSILNISGRVCHSSRELSVIRLSTFKLVQGKPLRILNPLDTIEIARQ
jgi:hypothetical protein